jgi:hypothetical protein
MIELLCVLLLITNIVQFFFWGKFTQKLINKIMSKNYAEYELIKSGPKQVEPKLPDPLEEELNKEILNELNGLMGINTGKTA